MARKMLMVGLAIMMGAAAASAGDNAMWIHVLVDEGGNDGEKVRVNLPLKLVETILPLIDEDEFSSGKIRIDDEDISADDLREIWDAVRDAEEGVYVEVEGVDEKITVARKGEYILIRVDGGRHDEVVDVKLPMAVIDALLSGDDDQLDLVAAIKAFGSRGGGDLVLVSDDESTVRVWIDDKSSGKENGS